MTATRALVGTGNTRATTEKWFPSGQAGAGEMLVRLFEVDGIGIPEVKLPLDRPIRSRADRYRHRNRTQRANCTL